VCGWQVKLCDLNVTHGPYLSALAVVLLIIRRYTNQQITLTLGIVEMLGLTQLQSDVDCHIFYSMNDSSSSDCVGFER